MMIITIEIVFGKGTNETKRVVSFDPEDLPLGFLEDLEIAQETDKWAPVRTAFQQMFDLSRDESRAITLRQFKEMGMRLQEAVKEQTTIPNG